MFKEKVIAALDIGPHSVLMLLAKCVKGGGIVPINEYVAVTRLAEGLPEAGALSDEGIAKTVQAAKEMQSIAMKEGADSLIVTAGSSIREAENRSKFLLKCHQSLGIYPQLLSAKDESRLTFLGASAEVEDGTPLLVVCVGGRNSQVAYGMKGQLAVAANLDVGVVTLEKLFAIGTSNSIIKQKSAQNHLKRELLPLSGDLDAWLRGLESPPATLATGGIANCYAAILKRRQVYDLKAVNMSASRRSELFDVFKRLVKMKPKDRMSVPGMEPELIEIMPAGLLSLFTILNFFNVEEFKTTSSGLRMGILKYFMERP